MSNKRRIYDLARTIETIHGHTPSISISRENDSNKFDNLTMHSQTYRKHSNTGYR